MICACTKGQRGGDKARAVQLDVLHKKEGITIADMLGALEENAEQTMEVWRNIVGLQVRHLGDMHWKHDIWYTYGKHKISFMLCREECEQDIAQGNYWEQMDDMRRRIEREGGGMSVEAMKPPKPTSPETEDVLSGIYGNL
jgi:hypothetical protein